MTHNHRTWCEVDLNAIKQNYKSIKALTADNVKIMAVVKADAYGHGAVTCARELERLGADYLAVAFTDEALSLIAEGITLPILILGVPDLSFATEIIENNITATVFDLETAKSLSETAVSLNKTAKVHIKVDTGMSRIGFYGASLLTAEKIAEINSLPNLEIEGIFTHFAKADDRDKEFTLKQFKKFTDIIECCEKKGVSFKIKHCCNSAAAMLYPEMHLDMIRIGICLYGCYPSKINYPARLTPAMTLKSRVIHLKSLKAGEPVSYGGTYKTKCDEKIATVAIGYGDGYSRLLSDKAEVLVDKSRAKIVGRICMDQCMIDVTNVNNISVGDEVVLFGTKDGCHLPVDELADIVGTISYELLCNVGKRVPRLYPNSL